MAEVISPHSETVIPDAPPLSEAQPPAPVNEVASSDGYEGDEEPFEEFIIEDFTIDGICGVY